MLERSSETWVFDQDIVKNNKERFHNKTSPRFPITDRRLFMCMSECMGVCMCLEKINLSCIKFQESCCETSEVLMVQKTRVNYLQPLTRMFSDIR